jgi:hypothetical protein
MAPLPPRPSPTVDAIFAAYEADAGDGMRAHLGASIIGKECARALWYDFRWVTRPAFPGRILRLFETGQLEENRLVRNLRRIGVTVLDVDPETGRQWRVDAQDERCCGHFGGSMDAAAIGLPEAPKTWHICEFKTHNAKSFAALKKQGVQKSKPQHYAQMQVYMHLTGITRALYLAVCKDTDALYAERVRADEADGLRLVVKAGRIIEAQYPPARVSDDPAWFQCRLCEHHAHCHESRPAVSNCRTCLQATPVEGGGWHCARWDRTLSVAEQRRGCPAHLFIPDLVHGEQIDAGDDWVDYRMPNGPVWRDGAR